MRNISAYLNSQSSLLSDKSYLKPPSFSRISGLLPNDSLQDRVDTVESPDTLDSFVKAQIVIYDQNSVLYHNIDKQVTVTLATLSFFCRRPTILAIMEFVNAINLDDESCESFSDNSSLAIVQHDLSRDEVVDNRPSTVVEEPTVKGLLGTGKSRIIFYLKLNMARAQIFLMNDNGSKLATLLQDNLLTDIKVFPSSFSIKAALGNLKISDDSLQSDHIYFWVCDMRNRGGSSFVELALLEIHASSNVFVYKFGNAKWLENYHWSHETMERSKLTWIEALANSLEGDCVHVIGPIGIMAFLELHVVVSFYSYLQLDVVHITVQNTFQWLYGSKRDMNAVHVEILSVQVEDINLNVGTGTEIGESIIQDVKGVTVIIRRSLRDLLHQIPSTEVSIRIEKLKAALSNREYQIITECALSNVSETPNIVPPPNYDSGKSPIDTGEPLSHQDSGAVDSEAENRVTWIAMKVSVDINLVELCLHYGIARDASLATVQISGAWILYKSNTLGEGFLSASLKGFSVIDDREGTEQALRLAVGKPENVGYNPSQYATDDEDSHMAWTDVLDSGDTKLVPTMLILDAKFGQNSTFVSLCIQRPQLLVALDFLLAVVEFFVPSVRSMLSNEEDENCSHIVDAVILDQPTYSQPSAEFSLSPQRPLVVDDERFDRFIYDGRGGTLYLYDRRGAILSSPSTDAIIYVGNGKRLQFKNVIIKDGRYLDSCIVLGTNSSYSASEYDQVYFEGGGESHRPDSNEQNTDNIASQNTPVPSSTELTVELQHGVYGLQSSAIHKWRGGLIYTRIAFVAYGGYVPGILFYINVLASYMFVFDCDAWYYFTEESSRSSVMLVHCFLCSADITLQAIGPELTFYNTSKAVGESLVLSNKLLHAQLDAFCRYFVLAIQVVKPKCLSCFSIANVVLHKASIALFLTSLLYLPGVSLLLNRDHVELLVLKGDTIEMDANALGVTMESNGIRILEPFDTSMKFSNASGKSNINFSVSDIFMNFSFSILRLFLAVEDDILSFLRMTSKKMTVICSEFDKVGTIESPNGDRVFAFWRPQAPPGFAVLGDYVTPLNKPPSKGVVAVNTSLTRVKRPVSFNLVWPSTTNGDISEFQAENHNTCSIWFPEAPKGYVALGCVVSSGRTPPPLASAFCIATSLVSPCSLRDCITISSNTNCSSSVAFWRVDNSFRTFLPAVPSTLSLVGRAYELRHILFGFPETSSASKSSYDETFPSDHAQALQSERPSTVNSGRRFEAVATFRLIWWNQGSNSRKKLSIWCPIVPPGMVYFGDIAVLGYEPPNTCIVFHDSGGDELFKSPIDFQLVGQIRKQRHVESISFWLPQAPPGFVSLGCVACKGTPKQSDFSSLRCLRSDMVTGDQFLEESIWDTSDIRFTKEPFSIWIVGNELGTFIVRSGFKKPPRRLALKLADPDVPRGSDDTAIDAQIGTFSAALFDDYGGLCCGLLPRQQEQVSCVPIMKNLEKVNVMFFDYHGSLDTLATGIMLG
ncbi:pleckstrin homology (PH) domain-containing protein [Actinidia rufa]|uniref:Pleckstrin homology (PH) domain-containing protein n=1 Tax=Actinidia rufa TaxID=165716 RepID=A0A7J0GXW8_9ERIC|nr:pleckstrin homology (PH) domain-containing protein [Actinidia rufa]